ncbi:MAG: AAA family ATPase [Pseudomonadota bacterium]
MSLDRIAEEVKSINKNITLIYAFNTTGKTRLSIAYKNLTKDASSGVHAGVYYNAFSEDLFTWDNDIENDEANIRLLVKSSSLSRLHSSFTEENVMRKLEQYKPRFNFFFDYHDDVQLGIKSISFHLPESENQTIKISRGEERIFIWCLFLAMFEVEGWTDVQNSHFFIDDPVSSLDHHNIFITAATLYQLIERYYEKRKIIITTHHIGLFSILADWLTKGEKSDRYKPVTALRILSRKDGTLALETNKSDVFLHHLHLIQILNNAVKTGLESYHFALLRQILENISSFLGVGRISYVLEQIGIENPGENLRIVNNLSHENVYRLKPVRMHPDNEELFFNIFIKLKEKYQFVTHSESNS